MMSSSSFAVIVTSLLMLDPAEARSSQEEQPSEEESPCVSFAAVQVSSLPEVGLSVVDAVERSLLLQPLLKLQEQQLVSVKGELQTSRGQFDAALTASFGHGRDELPFTQYERLQLRPRLEHVQTLDESTTTTVTNLTTYKITLQKQFRTGTTIAPSLELNRLRQNTLPTVSNRAGVSLALTQPLLRGFGRDVVTANERYSEAALGVSTFETRHVESEVALRTVVAYWSYLSAARKLIVIQESEGRSLEICDQTWALIRGQAIPGADIKQALASVVERRSQREAAEQDLFQARYNLGLAMGVPIHEIARLPLPEDAFPEVPDNEDALPSEERLSREAVERRNDLKSFRERETQAQVSLVAAENFVKPQLDLVASAGYNGLEEGNGFQFFFTPFENFPGFNASLNILYEWRTANNVAVGQRETSLAVREQTLIETLELERLIHSNVSVSLFSLNRSAARVRASRQAADLYVSASEDERRKQQLGASTVIDRLVTEDRVTRSQLAELVALQDYASTVAQLRFDTGTLLREPPRAADVDYENLITVPFLEER